MSSNKRVFVIMNGPTTSQLNWDVVNSELHGNTAIAIITNGFLSSGKLIDSENVIFLVNDPLIELVLKGDLHDLNDPATRKFLLDQYKFDDDHIEAFKYDLDSCKKLLASKYIRIAMRSNALCAHVFDQSRLMKFEFSFWEKLMIKFSFKWHQDGSAPAAILNRIGIKTFPYETRIFRSFIKNNFFGRVWYKINFCQTPNTFYRALDLASGLRANEVLFIGRNSQIDSWLHDVVPDENGSIPISYNYFFSNHPIGMRINCFEGLLREQYYSSQYIKMMSHVFPEKQFISLERSQCYKDFYHVQFAKNYLV